MNARNVIKASVIAALFAAGAAAQAAPMGEGDSQAGQPLQVQSARSFGSAQAASLASARRGGASTVGEAYGYNVIAAAPGDSHVDRAAVRSAAVQAERSGEIERGDALSF
ncbi:hypothetical protein [Xylophilus sp. GOD-11R]|uniref:hypothetical protein n=1 Tax=Xylophilus sp. GOD-11R TaxID=3089814 RepID=UPI00298C76EA|nr:hypothetical protein [Xylophilus sp. GOD-11R]WPB56611.1 hypothetical protein R9X41_21115 [Xylophilus sp. GOD-11R]